MYIHVYMCVYIFALLVSCHISPRYYGRETKFSTVNRLVYEKVVM